MKHVRDLHPLAAGPSNKFADPYVHPRNVGPVGRRADDDAPGSDVQKDEHLGLADPPPAQHASAQEIALPKTMGMPLQEIVPAAGASG